MTILGTEILGTAAEGVREGASAMTPAIVQAIATGIAACAAMASFLAAWMVKRQTQSQILLGCLQAYIGVRKHRQEALGIQSRVACEEYYRELFDLHWTEFRLWRARHIPKKVMKAWLDARYRNFQEDMLEVTDNTGTKHVISYRTVWNELVADKYFAPSDTFVLFMTLVHDGKIKEALKVKS